MQVRLFGMSKVNIIYLLLLIGAAFGLISCAEAPVEIEEDILVSVKDRKLYISDVKEVIPFDATSTDSAFIADRFVDNWIKEQVLLINAEEKLPEEEKDFEEEMRNYRNSLLSYTFERAIIDQQLDTLVLAEEIEAYYEENKDNFILKDYIVQVRFCILDVETKNLRAFKKLFNSNKSEDLVKLEQFCVDNNASYYFKEEEWLYFNELRDQIPLEVFNTARFLKTNKDIEFEKDKKLYFLKIEDYKLKDGMSPLSLQEENIRQIILNKRKNNLITVMREDLYKEAVKDGNIIWHENE